MSNGAGEAFIIHHDRHFGQFFLQIVDKGCDVLHALTGHAIELCGQPDDNEFHWFPGNIILDE